MKQDRGDQRERMAPALARGRRFGRIQAFDRLGGEIGLGQKRGGQRFIPFAKARAVFPWPTR